MVRHTKTILLLNIRSFSATKCQKVTERRHSNTTHKFYPSLCCKTKSSKIQVVKETIDSSATIEFRPNTADDPHKRKPDITKAKELLKWEPKISLRDGLPLMVTDFRTRILNEDEGKGL